jgi:hypothetical protein
MIKMIKVINLIIRLFGGWMRLFLGREGPVPATVGSIFCAANAEIELRAAQSCNLDAIAFGVPLDCALCFASILQIPAEPFAGKLALRAASAGGTGGQHFLRSEAAGASPQEVSGIVNFV